MPLLQCATQQMDDQAIQTPILGGRPFLESRVDIVGQAEHQANDSFGHDTRIHHLDTTSSEVYHNSTIMILAGEGFPMQEIPLTHGKVALVDDEDYERLVVFHWSATKSPIATGECWYALRTTQIGHGARTRKLIRILMHRFILDAPPGKEVDHVNGDGLDNRRENIRVCTHAENARNRHYVSGLSRFKGVQWVTRGRTPWVARIAVNGKLIHLGCFFSEEVAARAYNDAAREYFGEFARLNDLPSEIPEENRPFPRWRRKLSAKALIEIPMRYAQGDISRQELAAEYGVTETAIRYVLKGKIGTAYLEAMKDSKELL